MRAGGCEYFTPAGHGHVAGFPVSVVDTTGAGDGFVAGLLSGLLDHALQWDGAALQRVAVGVCGRRAGLHGARRDSGAPRAAVGALAARK